LKNDASEKKGPVKENVARCRNEGWERIRHPKQ
jgi:hypothetical protein